jgi:hypothetical protein
VVDTLLRAADGSFERFADVERYDGDPHQVEGAVLIHVDGKPLLTQAEWDELDSLWSFLVQAVDEALAIGEGERSFPDQPIRFRVKRLPTGRFLVSVDLGDERRGASADVDEFVRAIAAAGLAFFNHKNLIIRGAGGDQQHVDLCRRWLGSSAD